MRTHHRAFILAGFLAGLPAFGQGAGTSPRPQPPPAASGQEELSCPCPMMQGRGMQGRGVGPTGEGCPMSGLADVTVEETPDGATLRFTAKDPGRVADVQRMAQRMERCMSAGGAQGQGATPSQRP
jgi:hypothetical protein